MRSALVFSFFALQWPAAGMTQSRSTITIGLLDFEDAQRIRCEVVSNTYEWISLEHGQQRTVATLEGIDEVVKTEQGYSIATESGEEHSAYYILQPTSGNGTIRLISEPTGYRQYSGAVHFYWHANQWHIALESDLEDYVAGVLVAEVGKGHAMALYTAHAVVSRTYALNTFGRHRLEGFDVCDQVHCQVFDGVSTVNDSIRMGCTASRSLVLTDRLGRPIPAAFHSNCGGLTRSSAAVWQEASPHLLPVQDDACAHGAHAQWEKQIIGDEWKTWQPDSAQRAAFSMQTRKRFQLPSDRYEIGPQGDTLILSGRGFGHGVGMCQEGAMARAKHGESPWDILSAYYQEIRLRSTTQLTILEARGVWGK